MVAREKGTKVKGMGEGEKREREGGSLGWWRERGEEVNEGDIFPACPPHRAEAITLGLPAKIPAVSSCLWMTKQPQRRRGWRRRRRRQGWEGRQGRRKRKEEGRKRQRGGPWSGGRSEKRARVGGKDVGQK